MEISGRIRIYKNDHLIVDEQNLIVNWGLVNLAGVIAGTAFPSTISHLAMGTGTTAATESDTTLGTETRRDSATVTHLASPENNQVEFKVEHALGAVTGTFSEAGLFDAATGGNMFNRKVFDSFEVEATDTLVIIWTIEVKNP